MATVARVSCILFFIIFSSVIDMEGKMVEARQIDIPTLSAESVKIEVYGNCSSNFGYSCDTPAGKSKCDSDCYASYHGYDPTKVCQKSREHPRGQCICCHTIC
ncbi:hypothetical protein ABFS82_02G081800 [Erythranthe guttata]